MSEELIHQAIRNNVALCTAVCQTHGVGSIVRDGYWRAIAPPPPFYSNLITLDRSVTAEDGVTALAGIKGGGVKDSFANLDLASHGFTRLFEAHWIYRAPGPQEGPPTMRWKSLSSEDEFRSWRAMHGTAESLRPDLLGLDDFAVLQAEDSDGGSAGAVVNLSGPVAGVSNVFNAGPDHHAVWHDLAAVVSEHHPGYAVVGYERGDDLAAALGAGFQAIAPLQVWVRNP